MLHFPSSIKLSPVPFCSCDRFAYLFFVSAKIHLRHKRLKALIGKAPLLLMLSTFYKVTLSTRELFYIEKHSSKDLLYTYVFLGAMGKFFVTPL